MLPYYGLGSGITRALGERPEIDFVDDRDGCQFKAIVHRKEAKDSGGFDRLSKSSGMSSGIGSGKNEQKLLALLSETPSMTIPELAEILGISTRAVEKQIARFRQNGQLRRIGSARGGHWQVS
jgi:ATP-dependent DNA helicase RecG